jgi:predicted metal-dependent hydrolase
VSDSGFAHDLERGLELYRRRQFFEAHEVWEDRWLVSKGDERRLLHGLIQLAAGWHQLGKRGPKGAARLLRKALVRLEPLGDLCLGVNVAEFRREATEWLEAAQ